jgi:hypothetical protein
MRTVLLSTVLGVGLFLAPMAYAQTATVTATCKDGTDFSGTSRSDACKGHKGVASWGTAAAATATPGNPGIGPAAAPPSRSANAAPTTPPPNVPSKTATNTAGSSNTAGKMGGPGQVWVNTSTKVYHCPGDRYYGKTKAGEFMSQAAAEAAGDIPAAAKPALADIRGLRRGGGGDGPQPPSRASSTDPFPVQLRLGNETEFLARRRSVAGSVARLAGQVTDPS